jgi:hypothetical protein
MFIIEYLPGPSALSSLTLLLVAWLQTTSSGLEMLKKYKSLVKFSPHCIARRPAQCTNSRKQANR